VLKLSDFEKGFLLSKILSAFSLIGIFYFQMVWWLAVVSMIVYGFVMVFITREIHRVCHIWILERWKYGIALRSFRLWR